MKYALALVAIACYVAPAFGKKFSRCSLAHEMYSLGVPKQELAKWTCLAKDETSYHTEAFSIFGSINFYGLFQLDDFFWCAPSNGRFSFNYCKVNCDQFLADDIAAIVRCARKKKSETGWGGFPTWLDCFGTKPTDIDYCFDSNA